MDDDDDNDDVIAPPAQIMAAHFQRVRNNMLFSRSAHSLPYSNTPTHEHNT